MGAVSSRLAVSTRTLQRRLNAENTSFQLLLNRTREQLARHYLKGSTMSGAEISFLLGFEDPNSFFRAFHSWTGETPEQARTLMRAGV
jgi:AraC-like DNA-binding protein